MRLSYRTISSKKVLPGKTSPLGATLRKNGVNFAIYSKDADEVLLCLFKTAEGMPQDTIPLVKNPENIWSIFVPGLKAGQLYGYKIKGKYDPAQGFRFNKYKLLIDPYAKALTHKAINQSNLFLAFDEQSPLADLAMDKRDNAEIVPKCIVIDDTFPWQNDKSPNIPFEELLIYEVHLRGFTAHPSSRVKHRGTYLGFIEKIPYLKDLGINAVEFLPVHEYYIRDQLLNDGLTEYWGYNTIAFFAPEYGYSSMASLGCQVQEFKTLVRELHKAGIEVILDVVYNHTGEGNELGPTLCFKGIDNRTYYCLEGTPKEPYRKYKNDTGCGNTLMAENPIVTNLVLDSLRYWVKEMHVDGFRLDLAPVLAKVKGGFSKTSPFFDAVSKDPILKNVKMIAEPWDLTTYQVGNFPIGWSEWNGRFRDTGRRFLLCENGQIADFALRVTGSPDLYRANERSPHNSINFMTCHDGFTLRDLYSYNQKHNESNGENNKDGSDYNVSWNCGVEGNTPDPNIIRLRKQLVKNALCYLYFSLGTPMLLGGDEFMRTQQGNNNAYCQDNEISWFHWDFIRNNFDILEFTKKAIAFRKKHKVLNRHRFLSEKSSSADDVPDILWFGKNLDRPNWNDPQLKTLCYQLDSKENSRKSDSYYLFFIFNPDVNAQTILLPQNRGKKWHRVVDTSLPTGEDFVKPNEERLLEDQNQYQIYGRSVAVLIKK